MKTNFAVQIFVSLLLVLGALEYSRADVSLKQEAGRIVLENEFVRVGINPANGGVVDDYFVKATRRQLVSAPQFLLGDHFWQQGWPGEFLSVPYDSKVVAQSPNEVTIEVARTSVGWGGIKTQNDLRIMRRMTLRSDSGAIWVEINIQNVGKVGRVAGYWSQSLAYAGGSKDEKQTYFRPSARAVSEATYQSVGNNYAIDQYGDKDGFVRDPQNGWMAAVGADTKSGLAFVMPYDELLYLYNSLPSFTTEWQYKNAAIPAGKVWKTDFVVYPIEGFSRVDFASRNLTAATNPRDENGNLKVEIQLAAAASSLQNVSVEGEVLQLRGAKKVTPLAAQTLAQIGRAPQSISFQAPHDPNEPVSLRFTIRGDNAGRKFEEQFQTWFGAGYGRNWQTDGGPLYVLPAPERHITFLKPDKIEKTRNATPRVFVVRGMFAKEYLPDSVWAPLKAQVVPAYFKPTGIFPATMSDFPASYEELMALDVIALINIDADALGEVGQEMLKDFVEQGGTLVYGGDLWAFGRGNLGQGQIALLLPVTFAGASKKVPQYLQPQPIKVLSGGKPGVLAPDAVMMYSAGGCFLPKTGAQVVATVGAEPIVTTWKVGKGRVIALTGSALGIAPKGKTLFTRTPQWAALLTRILQMP